MCAARPIQLDNADPANVRTVRRFDVVGVLQKPFRRPSDGAILAEGVICRECVQVYKLADGTERRELVTRQAVLDTARTIARAPMTLNHPPGGFVTKQNADRLVTGDVDGEVFVEETAQGAFARIKVALRRQDAIDAFESGAAVELSPGYEVTLDETSGNHPIHGDYDAAQIGRDCNHSAQVPKGRGLNPVLRTDADDAYQVSTWSPPMRLDESKFGTNLRRIAGEKEVTTAQLAQAAGISPGAVVDIMNGRIEVPPMKRIRAFARVLKVSVESLLGKLPEEAKEELKEDRHDSRGVHMNPHLLALLSLLGVGRFDSEDVALEHGLVAAKKLRDDADEATKKAEELEKEKEDAFDPEQFKKKEKDMQDKIDALMAENETLKSDAEKMKKEKQDRADAAELTTLRADAERTGVRHDGLELPALRFAVAKKRYPGLADDASPIAVDTVLAMVRADATAKPAGSGSKWSGDYNGSNNRNDTGNSGGSRGDERDEFYHPDAVHGDKLRNDSITAAGGAR